MHKSRRIAKVSKGTQQRNKNHKKWHKSERCLTRHLLYPFNLSNISSNFKQDRFVSNGASNTGIVRKVQLKLIWRCKIINLFSTITLSTTADMSILEHSTPKHYIGTNLRISLTCTCGWKTPNSSKQDLLSIRQDAEALPMRPLSEDLLVAKAVMVVTLSEV